MYVCLAQLVCISRFVGYALVRDDHPEHSDSDKSLKLAPGMRRPVNRSLDERSGSHKDQTGATLHFPAFPPDVAMKLSRKMVPGFFPQWRPWSRVAYSRAALGSWMGRGGRDQPARVLAVEDGCDLAAGVEDGVWNRSSVMGRSSSRKTGGSTTRVHWMRRSFSSVEHGLIPCGGCGAPALCDVV